MEIEFFAKTIQIKQFCKKTYWMKKAMTISDVLLFSHPNRKQSKID